jgi:hypothetical protein
LHVANQTETSFQLIDKITVGGKLTDVFTNFKSKLTKLKYNYEKISIVTLALLMTVGTFSSCESLKNKQNAERCRNWSSQWRNNWRYLR